MTYWYLRHKYHSDLYWITNIRIYNDLWSAYMDFKENSKYSRYVWQLIRVEPDALEISGRKFNKTTIHIESEPYQCVPSSSSSSCALRASLCSWLQTLQQILRRF